jgi:HSP20 family protein
MQTFRAGFALPLEELRDEMDRLWTSLTAAPPLHGWGTEQRAGVFPAVNMRDRDDAIVVEAELPGLDVGDIDINVTADEIILKGRRPEAAEGRRPEAAEGRRPEATEGRRPEPAGQAGNGEAAEGDATKVTWLRRERGTGAFERRLSLPVAVDASLVEAHLVDGVLTVTCPKAPESQPHKVTVRTAS